MSADNWTKVQEVCDAVPVPDGANYKYGTAGFRMNADELDPVFVRVGVAAALRSQTWAGGVGVMVTASHNPPCDNGVKLVEPTGDMLAPEWEDHVVALANADGAQAAKLAEELFGLVTCLDMPMPYVFVARDTRESGPRLLDRLLSGLSAMDAVVVDHGEMTTPQLHFVVRYARDNRNVPYTVEAGENAYYAKLVDGFKALTEGVELSGRGGVVIDGANGIGAVKAERLVSDLAGLLDVSIINHPRDGGVLNEGCGADFVKTSQGPTGNAPGAGVRVASLDGDADRLIYSVVNDDGSFTLLDGDKIAALFASFLIEQLNAIGGSFAALTLGVVQTAYANGAATSYIAESLGVEVACTKTGVKNLHHKAVDYDVGVYFEANGHGTVVFSRAAHALIDDVLAKPTESIGDEAAQLAFRRLVAFRQTINEVVGDALSDMLAVEGILAVQGRTVAEWATLYTELPNRLTKAVVPDRSAFVVTNADRTVVEPAGLQEGIDAVVAKYPGSRSFVRPSGTEDVVRVYAEAPEGVTDDGTAVVDAIIAEVEELVQKAAAGEL